MAKATITRKIGFLHVPRDGADGKPGEPGKDGTSVTITRKAVMYAVQESGTELRTPGWSRDIPEVPSGMYLWTRTAVEYSDGTETISYSVSRNASDGLPGKTYKPMRIRDWDSIAAGETLYEGSGDDDPWTDMAVTNTPEAYYRVVSTFTVPSVKGLPSDSAYRGRLQASSQFKAVATELLLAKSAVIRIMSGNRVIVLDDGGVATAGLSGSLEGERTRIFAGGAIPDKAPFRVAEDGSMHSTKAYIDGTVTARTMSLGVATNNIDQTLDDNELPIPDGAFYFDVYRIKLPELSPNQMRVIKVMNPILTRSGPQPLRLVPATSKVYIVSSWNWTSLSSGTVEIPDVVNAGVYAELLGYCVSIFGKDPLTVWKFTIIEKTE